MVNGDVLHHVGFDPAALRRLDGEILELHPGDDGRGGGERRCAGGDGIAVQEHPNAGIVRLDTEVPDDDVDRALDPDHGVGALGHGDRRERLNQAARPAPA